jgi:Homeodomain-like domain
MAIPKKLRWAIILELEKGLTPSAVAKQLKVKPATVKRWHARYQLTGNVEDAARRGRPSMLSHEARHEALDLLLVGEVGGAQDAAVALQSTNRVVSKHTIIRAARAAAVERGIRLRALRGKPQKLLSAASRQRRLAFCTANRKRSWKAVLFTDRKKFLFRYPGTKVHPVSWVADDGERRAHQVNHAHQVNVYAGISVHGMTKLHVVAGTTGHKTQHKTKQGKDAKNITSSEYKQVLERTLLPEGRRLFASQGISSWVFQQDNDPTHKMAAEIIRAFNYKQGSSITLLENWPPSSPDLSLIENVWGILQARMDKAGCKTFPAFKAALVNEAARLTEELPCMCKNLFDSMPKRVMMCIQKGGDYTKH